MSDDFKVLSLGAGVQSSTLFMMSCMGEVERFDCAIFADTQSEPKHVYEYLTWLQGQGEKYGIPIHVVSAGSLRDDAVARAEDRAKRGAAIPFFLAWEDGKAAGLGRRQCTGDYKIVPLKRKARELMKAAGKRRITMNIGISTDEIQRMRLSGVKYIENNYPLIDLRMSRSDCIEWYNKSGFPAPPRSACTFCPYHSDNEWRRMRDEDPESWQDAVEFDKKMRNIPRIKGTCYLHRSLKPLDEVDLDTPEDMGQMDFGFAGECQGMCGL